MEEKKQNRKALIVAIALVLLLIITGTFAWLRISRTTTVVNKITAGSLDLVLDEVCEEGENCDGILLQNQMPMSYQQGLTTKAYKFKIKNNAQTAADYTISIDDYYEIVTVPSAGKIDDSKLRYILLKDDETPTAAKSKLLSTGRNIETGVIQGGKEVSYTLYMWIDSRAGLETNGQMFNGRLNILAEQTVTTPYKMSGTITDGSGVPVTNGVVVAFSDPKYAEVSNTGVFSLSGIEYGAHTIYYIPAGTLESVQGMSATELEAMEGVGKASFNTSDTDTSIALSNGYIINTVSISSISETQAPSTDSETP